MRRSYPLHSVRCTHTIHTIDSAKWCLFAPHIMRSDAIQYVHVQFGRRCSFRCLYLYGSSFVHRHTHTHTSQRTPPHALCTRTLNVGAGESLPFVIQRRHTERSEHMQTEHTKNHSIRTQIWNINVGVSPYPFATRFPLPKKNTKKNRFNILDRRT